MRIERDPESRTPSAYVGRPLSQDYFHGQAKFLLEALSDVNFLHSEEIKRICLHEKNSPDINVMLISEKFGKEKRPKRHRNRSKLFILLKGQMKVVIYGEDNSVFTTIELSELTENSFFLVPANFSHINSAISQEITYLEIIRGPFTREVEHTEYL